MSETTRTPEPAGTNENPAASSDDRRQDGTSGEPERNGAATGPKDGVTGAVREVPEEPGDRPGTEAEEGRR
ncbi:hypothetical protein [Methylobacterium sp. 77]|uniref:hypothetical protein n=1 Tax=Methylobacterium sp. 77 TaxID=1101192 RepID=UPI000363A7F2|nr:hypothetical protein [Methylobacterium sp. 77]